MASLIKTLRQLPDALAMAGALSKAVIRIGGSGVSRFDINTKQAELNISTPDLLRALPSGAGYTIIASPTAPVNPPANTLWIQTGGTTVTTMSTQPLFFIGQLVLNQIFGYFNPVGAITLTTADIFAQTAPTGTDAIFTLVDGSGTSLGVTLTLPAGQNYVHLSCPLAVAAGGVVRAKITQLGGTIPGGYITIALNYSS